VRFEIRSRTDADLASCALGLKEVYDSDRYPQSFPDDPIQWLQPPRQRRAWVAVVDDGAIAGHAALNVTAGDPALSAWTAGTGLSADKLAAIARMYVRPAARRRGIALGLLTTATSEAHRQGLQPVLDVLQVDRGAIALYEKAGWQRAGTVTFTSPRTGELLPAFVYAGPPPPAAGNHC
jgi:GNAT superfamily N-acetyltransferase